MESVPVRGTRVERGKVGRVFILASFVVVGGKKKKKRQTRSRDLTVKLQGLACWLCGIKKGGKDERENGTVVEIA